MNIYIPVCFEDDKGGYFEIQSSTIFDNSSELIVTGLIDEKVLEYIQIAITYFRANAIKYNLNSEILKETNHFHFSNNNFMKKGPSMISGIFISVYFMLKNIKKYKNRVLITGGVDLYGNLEEVGGLEIKTQISIINKFDNFIYPDFKHGIRHIDDILKIMGVWE